VHPTVVQALAAERVRDWQEQAELARQVKRARRARRGGAEPAAGLTPADNQALRMIERELSARGTATASEDHQPAGAGRA
jgi:hypothetical protein